jgi:hypothetical protein
MCVRIVNSKKEFCSQKYVLNGDIKAFLNTNCMYEVNV